MLANWAYTEPGATTTAGLFLEPAGLLLSCGSATSLELVAGIGSSRATVASSQQRLQLEKQHIPCIGVLDGPVDRLRL